MSGATRVDEIAAELRNEILRGRHRPGERFASERDLAQRFGVHRGSAREALKQLAQLGLLEIGRGGARVAPLHAASLDVIGPLLEMDDVPDPVLAAQLLDVHELLMAGAVRIAVERASETEIAEARTHLRRLRDPALHDGAYLESHDALIHLITRASQNLVLRIVRNGLQTSFTHRLQASGVRLRPARAVLESAAACIDAALEARDAAAAEDGVRQLLRANRERVLKALDAERARVNSLTASPLE